VDVPEILSPEVRDLDVVEVDEVGDPRAEGGRRRTQADW